MIKIQRKVPYVRVRVSAAWLTGGVCVSVCVSSVVDGVCVSVCVSSVVDRKGVCAHVTRLHALCGNKLPPFYVPPGCSHWVRARGLMVCECLSPRFLSWMN